MMSLSIRPYDREMLYRNSIAVVVDVLHIASLVACPLLSSSLYTYRMHY